MCAWECMVTFIITRLWRSVAIIVVVAGVGTIAYRGFMIHLEHTSGSNVPLLDWLKARSYEAAHFERAKSALPTANREDIWLFQTQGYGARRYRDKQGTFVIVFGPATDVDYAYIVTAEGRLFRSPDDAQSLGLGFSDLEGSSPEYFANDVLGPWSLERYLQRWKEVW